MFQIVRQKASASLRAWQVLKSMTWIAQLVESWRNVADLRPRRLSFCQHINYILAHVSIKIRKIFDFRHFRSNPPSIWIYRDRIWNTHCNSFSLIFFLHPPSFIYFLIQHPPANLLKGAQHASGTIHLNHPIPPRFLPPHLFWFNKKCKNIKCLLFDFPNVY